MNANPMRHTHLNNTNEIVNNNVIFRLDFVRKP